MYTPSGFIRLTQIRNFKFFENRDPKKKHRQTVFLQNAMRLPRSLSFANIAKGKLSKNPFNGTANLFISMSTLSEFPVLSYSFTGGVAK